MVASIGTNDGGEKQGHAVSWIRVLSTRDYKMKNVLQLVIHFGLNRNDLSQCIDSWAVTKGLESRQRLNREK